MFYNCSCSTCLLLHIVLYYSYELHDEYTINCIKEDKMRLIRSTAFILSSSTKIFFLYIAQIILFLIECLISIPCTIIAQACKFKVWISAFCSIVTFLVVFLRARAANQSIISVLWTDGKHSSLFFVTIISVPISIFVLIWMLYKITNPILAAVNTKRLDCILEIRTLRLHRKDSFNQLAFRNDEEKEKALRDDFKKKYKRFMID